jgi:hypothetical protein
MPSTAFVKKVWRAIETNDYEMFVQAMGTRKGQRRMNAERYITDPEYIKGEPFYMDPTCVYMLAVRYCRYEMIKFMVGVISCCFIFIFQIADKRMRCEREQGRQTWQ